MFFVLVFSLEATLNIKFIFIMDSLVTEENVDKKSFNIYEACHFTCYLINIKLIKLSGYFTTYSKLRLFYPLKILK